MYKVQVVCLIFLLPQFKHFDFKEFSTSFIIYFKDVCYAIMATGNFFEA